MDTPGNGGCFRITENRVGRSEPATFPMGRWVDMARTPNADWGGSEIDR
jgi:hypothetical protein